MLVTYITPTVRVFCKVIYTYSFTFPGLVVHRNAPFLWALSFLGMGLLVVQRWKTYNRRSHMWFCVCVCQRPACSISLAKCQQYSSVTLWVSRSWEAYTGFWTRVEVLGLLQPLCLNMTHRVSGTGSAIVRLACSKKTLIIIYLH
jgi:hypothetical protein